MVDGEYVTPLKKNGAVGLLNGQGESVLKCLVSARMVPEYGVGATIDFADNGRFCSQEMVGLVERQRNGSIKIAFHFQNDFVQCIQCTGALTVIVAELLKLELAFDDIGQISERFLVPVRKVPRFFVDNAQGANAKAGAVFQRCARIETDVRFSRDQGVVGEPLIGEGIGNHESLGFQDGMAAERNVTTGFPDSQAIAGLEPLAFPVDQ